MLMQRLEAADTTVSPWRERSRCGRL